MIKKRFSNVVILFSSLIGLSSVVVDGAFAQAWILQECGSKYQELKAASGLAGKNWQDFLKDCSTQLRLHSKYIIPEDIMKGALKHQHDPENKDGEATGPVEPTPDYMSRDDWTPERWTQARRNRIAKTPNSGRSATTPRGKTTDKTPTHAIQPTVVESRKFQSSSNGTEARIHRPRRHVGKLPKFTEFGINEKIRHGYNPPDFKKRDKNVRDFRTRILEGMKVGPNFAGHFSIIEIGCGTSCRTVYVADNITGRVIDFPIGGEEYQSLDLKYKLNSRLIIASYQKYTCDIAFFKIKAGRIKKIKTVKYPPPENYGPCVFD